jgi:chemotaxis-related protein WspD
MARDRAVPDSSRNDAESDRPEVGDCWNTIGALGDQSCPELNTHIHCRNCPIFAKAACSFFERRAPEGYLADWSRWLAEPAGVGLRSDTREEAGDHFLSQDEAVSVLIFQLGEEWMAIRTKTVAEITLLKPVHRIPHRSNAVLIGIVNLRGQLQLCVSLHGLLGATAAPTPAPRLIVLRDADRAEMWAFAADGVVGVRRVPRTQWRSVPSTLINPAVGFSEAVLSWDGKTVGLLDEQRVFTALRSLGR